MSSARQRDGARIPHFINPIPEIPPSEIFYNAACKAIPKDLLKAMDFDYKRAKSLLTMVCLQYGRVVEVKLHLGELNTMCSLEGFHNESRWPSGLNPIEVEERRRLVSALSRLIESSLAAKSPLSTVLDHISGGYLRIGHLGFDDFA